MPQSSCDKASANLTCQRGRQKPEGVRGWSKQLVTSVCPSQGATTLHLQLLSTLPLDQGAGTCHNWSEEHLYAYVRPLTEQHHLALSSVRVAVMGLRFFYTQPLQHRF